MVNTVAVRKVNRENCAEVREFIVRIRKELFPMLAQNEIPTDLLHFEEHYFQNEDTGVYAAYSQEDEVIGTIAIQRYDGRFDRLLGYNSQTETAEVVKCYIDENYRRLGIGTILFDEAKKFSIDAGYQKLYLHSHPFLPGGIPFWIAKGFQERLAEDDPIWNTLHMDMEI